MIGAYRTERSEAVNATSNKSYHIRIFLVLFLGQAKLIANTVPAAVPASSYNSDDQHIR